MQLYFHFASKSYFLLSLQIPQDKAKYGLLAFIDMAAPFFDTGKSYKPLHLRRYVVSYAATHAHEVIVINLKFSFPLVKCPKF